MPYGYFSCFSCIANYKYEWHKILNAKIETLSSKYSFSLTSALEQKGRQLLFLGNHDQFLFQIGIAVRLCLNRTERHSYNSCRLIPRCPLPNPSYAWQSHFVKKYNMYAYTITNSVMITSRPFLFSLSLPSYRVK